jgi:hypothetical protein
LNKKELLLFCGAKAIFFAVFNSSHCLSNKLDLLTPRLAAANRLFPDGALTDVQAARSSRLPTAARGADRFLFPRAAPSPASLRHCAVADVVYDSERANLTDRSARDPLQSDSGLFSY